MPIVQTPRRDSVEREPTNAVNARPREWVHSMKRNRVVEFRGGKPGARELPSRRSNT